MATTNAIARCLTTTQREKQDVNELHCQEQNTKRCSFFECLERKCGGVMTNEH